MLSSSFKQVSFKAISSFSAQRLCLFAPRYGNIQSRMAQVWRQSPVVCYTCCFSTKKDENDEITPISTVIPEMKRLLSEFSEKIDSLLKNKVVDLVTLKGIVKDLEMETSDESLWDDQEKAQAIFTELTHKKDLISRVEKWIAVKDETEILLELYSSSPDDTGIVFSSILNKFLIDFSVQKIS